MKKLLSVILAIIMVFAVTSCGSTPQSGSDSETGGASKTEKSFGLGVVNGAPALAVANIASGFDFSNQTNEITTNVKVENEADAVVAGLTNGTFDMAILPVNLAAKLYNANQLGVKLASINIFSVLYVLTKGEYSTLNDLKGKTVYSVGAGGTPEITFKNILEKNNIKYADLSESETKADDTVYFTAAAKNVVVQAIQNGEADFALLGEPVATQIMDQTGAKIAFSIEDEWKKVHPEVGFIQAGLLVKNDISENYGDYLDALMQKMAGNKEYINANPEKSVADLKLIGATLPALNAETLSRCKIGADSAKSRQADVEAFLSVLPAQMYGGKLPDAAFYVR